MTAGFSFRGRVLLAFGIALCAGLSLTFIVPTLGLRLAGWGYFSIVSGHSKPALLAGDVVLAAPYSDDNPPRRGEFIFFKWPGGRDTQVHRVIGMSNETITIRNGITEIDGQIVRRVPTDDFVEPYVDFAGRYPLCQNTPSHGDDCTKPAFTERIPGGREIMVLDFAPGGELVFGPVEVPPHHVFVMGDNRDNSVDSRTDVRLGGPGFVPIVNITHTARFVHYSLGSAGFPWLRFDRIWKRIE